MLTTTIRRPSVRVTLTRWQWDSVQKVDPTELNITEAISGYSYTNSIRQPYGEATISMLPQARRENILDVASPMDVIRIYEFDVLKYQGYIRSITFTGEIQPSGEPRREATIHVRSFGALLTDRAVGLSLGSLVGQATALVDAAAQLYTNIGNKLQQGSTYSQLLTVLFDSWFTFIRQIGGTMFDRYVSTYLDLNSAITRSSLPGTPKSFSLFTGSEQSLTLWQLLQQLLEMPLMEAWFDCSGAPYVDNAEWSLSSGRTALVVRRTPYNGTVQSWSSQLSVTQELFDMLPLLFVPKRYTKRFDLSRSCDESYSAYIAVDPAEDPGNMMRSLLGMAVLDSAALNKYMLKPLELQLFYTRTASADGTTKDPLATTVPTVITNIARTLKNWFEHNDEYLNGVVTMMVPDDVRKDPHIGQRVQFEGITGTFYVETVAHQWTYQGPLQSNVTVTRGVDGTRANSKIKLTDALFRRLTAGVAKRVL